MRRKSEPTNSRRAPTKLPCGIVKRRSVTLGSLRCELHIDCRYLFTVVQNNSAGRPDLQKPIAPSPGPMIAAIAIAENDGVVCKPSWM